MGIGRTWAVSLLGVDGVLVEVEADISAQLPAFSIIGLGDRSLKEAEWRVRQAAANSGCRLSPHRITVNLSPASVPKHGSGFDLGIAIACLAADGVIDTGSVDRTVHVGELGLDGRLRPTPGVLPAVLAASRAGRSVVMVPTANADEAALVPGMRVIGVPSLRDAAIRHGADLDPIPVEPILTRAAAPADPEPVSDVSDVVGQPEAVDALAIAAAGGHHLLMIGPPGAGKTMLAARLPGLLPDLDPEQALEVTSVRSLAGEAISARLVTRPGFESPHHSATAASILGGGSTVIRPGAAARAAHGILFLDEAPEFSRAVLDTLRQPLESGVITVHRAAGVARFPGRFQLVLAANPCPCGQYGSRDGSCTCAPSTIRRYLGRMSGPLLDRIDIHLAVRRITASMLRLADERRGPTTATIRSEVAEARERAARRLADTPWRLNGDVPGAWLRSPDARPEPGATEGIDRALERGVLTMRGYDRVLRVAWSVADLARADRPSAEHVGRALFLRKGMPT